MLRRSFRFVFRAGIIGAAVAAVAKVVQGRRAGAPAPVPAAGPLPRESWPPLEPDPTPHGPTTGTALQPDPEAPASAPVTDDVPLAPAPEASDLAPAPAPAPTDAGPDPIAESDVAWVEPDGDVCPTTHPVKAKLASKIFHVPGGLSYARTKPDRCYRDAGTAEADGLRPAKR